MDEILNIDIKRDVFGLIFQLSNELQKYLDKILYEYNLTGKQFLLLIIIGTFENGKPTLGDLATTFGSSHQNVKQIALKLEKSGYVEIEVNKKDARKRHFTLTEKSIRFWEDRDKSDMEIFLHLFSNIEENTIDKMKQGMNKIYENIKKI